LPNPTARPSPSTFVLTKYNTVIFVVVVLRCLVFTFDEMICTAAREMRWSHLRPASICLPFDGTWWLCLLAPKMLVFASFHRSQYVDLAGLAHRQAQDLLRGHFPKLIGCRISLHEVARVRARITGQHRQRHIDGSPRHFERMGRTLHRSPPPRLPARDR
jgi:hypothetical protein